MHARGPTREEGGVAGGGAHGPASAFYFHVQAEGLKPGRGALQHVRCTHSGWEPR